MDKRKTVLVVEDEARFYEPIQKALFDSGLVSEVIVINRLTYAEAAFDEVKHRIDAVLMDACLEIDVPDTLELTAHIRDNFSGVMVAMSRESMFRREQMNAGCDHECSKLVAAKYLIELLKATEAAAA